MEVRYGLYMSVDFEEGFVLAAKGCRNSHKICTRSIDATILVWSGSGEAGRCDSTVVKTR